MDKQESEITQCRALRNKAEEEFRQHAIEKGWTPCKRGWPDFFCEKDGKICLVEIKPKGSNHLKKEQQRVMEVLASYGVPCYRWSPDGGFVKIESHCEIQK